MSLSKLSNLKKLNKNDLIDSIRFSIRITPKSVTSVSLKKNIVSLWILLRELDKSNGSNYSYRDHVLNFVYEALEEWNKDTAKGFSEFITEKMIKQILEKDDYLEYQKIKKDLV